MPSSRVCQGSPFCSATGVLSPGARRGRRYAYAQRIVLAFTRASPPRAIGPWSREAERQSA